MLCGDFQETIPVVPHSGRAGNIEISVKSWSKWSRIKNLALSQNMREFLSEIEFTEVFKQIGTGNLEDVTDVTKLIGKNWFYNQ